MIRRRLTSIAAAVALALTGAAAVGPTASAAAKPSANLTFTPNKVTASKPITLKYTSAHLPAGSTLYLQWQVGTAHVWKRYAVLKGVSGTASEKGQPLGKYEFRIYVSTKTKAVTASVGRFLYSYGNVALSEICREFNGSTCQGGTIQVGDNVYSYADEYGVQNEYPDYDSFNHTTCASAHLTYAGYPPDVNGNYVTYEKVVQAKSNAVDSSAQPNTIGTLNVKFDGGPWILDVSTNVTNLEDSIPIYLNGTFECYTSTGL
jgi:hypothetical protein